MTCAIELAWIWANEFGEFHRLDALDVDVTLLPQPRHAGQPDFVRCVLKLFGGQDHASQCQAGIGSSRDNEGMTRFANHTHVDKPNGLRLFSRSKLISQFVAAGRRAVIFRAVGLYGERVLMIKAPKRSLPRAFQFGIDTAFGDCAHGPK
jgi:hypothetical protein